MSWFSNIGKAVSKAVKDTGKAVGHAVSQVSPVLSYIPGVGTLAAGGLSTIGGLLDGKNVGDSLKQGAGAALGGGGGLLGMIGAGAHAAGNIIGGGSKPGSAAVGGIAPPPSSTAPMSRADDATDQMAAAAQARHAASPAFAANITESLKPKSYDMSWMQDKGNAFSQNFAPPTATLASLEPAAAAPAASSTPAPAASATAAELLKRFAPRVV